MELSQRWREVYEEARQFSEEVARLPDDCHCQDADAHLEERCPCCVDYRRASEPRDPGRKCTDILACLRADVSLLCEDFKQVAGPLVKGTESELPSTSGGASSFRRTTSSGSYRPWKESTRRSSGFGGPARSRECEASSVTPLTFASTATSSTQGCNTRNRRIVSPTYRQAARACGRQGATP